MRILFSLFLLCPLFMSAQNNDTRVEYRTITDFWIADPADFEEDWDVSLRNNKPPFPGGEGERQFLERQKAKSAEMFPRTGIVEASRGLREGNDSLIVVDSFAASFFLNGAPLVGGTPNDNAMAISNEGKLIASWNSQIWGYDLEEDTFLFNPSSPHPSFSAFVSNYTTGDPGLIQRHFDPKMFYDPTRDRFIFLFLTVSNTYTNSATIMAFSSTNNPSDPWYVYRIDGHPFQDGTWADYPQIALNDHSLYFTINQLSGNDWVSDFEYTVIWQMDLEDAFSGSPLESRVIANDAHDNLQRRYLRPVKTAGGPYGNDMYFISNIPRSIESDSVWLWKLEGTIADGNLPSSELLISDVKYGIPPYAQQSDGHTFWTNDARPLGAVLIGKEIQFVGNSINHESGMAGVYHGIIEDVDNPTLKGNIISDDVLEFGFANIVSMGKLTSTKDVIINFNHTSPVHPAGNAAVFFNDDREYGPIQLLVQGDSYVDMISQAQDPNERWGDYIGMQRKYNERSRAWAAGYISLPNHRDGTWISELATPDDGYVGVSDTEIQKKGVVFPNPTNELVAFKFNLDAAQEIKASVYDLNGRLVKLLLHSHASQGENILSFSIGALPSGIYVLNVTSGTEVILSERVVKN